MSNVVQAKNASLMVNVGGTYYLIGCETDFTYHYTNETILKTGVNSGSWRDRRVRISDNSGACQGVVTTSNNADSISIFYLLQDAVRRKIQQLLFTWQDDDGGQVQLTGYFLIKDIDIPNTEGDFSKFDLQLEGAGSGISIDPVLPPDPESDEGIDSDVWNTTSGAFTISGLGIDGKSFAGKTLFMVAREGGVYFPESPLTTTTGYSFDSTTITFIIAFNPGERVTVAWHD